MKYVLEPIHRPVDKVDRRLVDCLGSGYVGNTHFVIWKGRYAGQLFFKDISKPEDEGWFALCEVEEIKESDQEKEK